MRKILISLKVEKLQLKFSSEEDVRLSTVIEELTEERGIDRSTISTVVTEGILAAYQKKYPSAHLSAVYNKKTNEINIVAEKKVVTSVQDEETEIALRKARSIDEKAEVGNTVSVPFEKPIGRIEILKAKQVISQRMREIEARIIYEEYKPKEGTVVNGIIHKCETSGITLKVHDVFAFLPKSRMLPTDKCIVGYNMRALLKEVVPDYSSESQLILDRASPQFLRILFELEIPEVYERIIEIKRIVRSPGYKAKVLVTSHDENIDPVGTCVGVGGSRIKPILREIGSEKIDIIPGDLPLTDLIKRSLKPAEVDRVEVENGAANVWVADDQRSVAIGKMGQNISLASQLTDVEIHLVRPEPAPDLDLEEGELQEEASVNESEVSEHSEE